MGSNYKPLVLLLVSVLLVLPLVELYNRRNLVHFTNVRAYEQPESQREVMLPEVNGSYGNGQVVLKTSLLNIKITGGGHVPHFSFWPTKNNSTVYHAKFVLLAEYTDTNGDEAFQYDEIVKMPPHPPKVFPFSRFASRWEFTGFSSISRNGESLGVGFNFTMSNFTLPGQFREIFPEKLAITISNRFYHRNVRETLEADDESVVFNVSGLTALKTNVKVTGWSFESDKNMLALRWDITQTGKKTQARVGGKVVDFDEYMKNGSEKHIEPPKNRNQVGVVFKASEKANASFKTANVVKLTNAAQNSSKLANSSMSYRTGERTLRMFMSAPAVDGTILYDPITAMSIEDKEDPTLTVDVPSPGETLYTETVTFSWRGSDESTAIDHFELKLDDREWFDVSKNVMYTFTDLNEGIHTVLIKAVDIVGHSVTVSVTFIIRFIDLFKVTVYGILFAIPFIALLTGSVFFYLKKKGAF
ncbi:MAG: hypothetical protein GWO20_13920 [Candidatus Korarchaeota archaeon]|nr:hypothetical protein [Candidatus Korarchaeota archaeon]NIU84514.1 hypothetical protein [Candidatus Thorarchaeota archaeon]NIW14581.1 hypothetical protein [Candidatus Thorarchaeota archaeon]NIW52653.1 hypothetical protein [Candidatus Korarchaeota archaeon]